MLPNDNEIDQKILGQGSPEIIAILRQAGDHIYGMVEVLIYTNTCFKSTVSKNLFILIFGQQ